MNILKFIESFTNENFNQTLGSRRDSFGQFKKMGSDLAMASVPFGI
ncbi:MAG: ferritin-like domain-containing protein, partial [Burkholderiales bacterium]|nr:ferritin-like domain-containing protein [Flavobacterium sp.]